MRLVSHPNVVDLRAFFYSNGEKVRAADEGPTPDRHSRRRTRSTSIWSSNTCPRRSTGRRDTMPSSSRRCRCPTSGCTCTSCFGRSTTSTPSASATATSSRKTCCSTRKLASSSCATLARPRSWSPASPTSRTSARATTARPSSSLAQRTTRPTSVRGEGVAGAC